MCGPGHGIRRSPAHAPVTVPSSRLPGRLSGPTRDAASGGAPGAHAPGKTPRGFRDQPGAQPSSILGAAHGPVTNRARERREHRVRPPGAVPGPPSARDRPALPATGSARAPLRHVVPPVATWYADDEHVTEYARLAGADRERRARGRRGRPSRPLHRSRPRPVSPDAYEQVVECHGHRTVVPKRAHRRPGPPLAGRRYRVRDMQVGSAVPG